MTQAYLAFESITKSYAGVQALRGVSFSAREGSVHALLGENGAGKSTLLKTLAGAHQPTSGSLRLGGQSVVFRNTADAIAAGIAVIYQELHLVPELTVAENLLLGHLPSSGGVLRRKMMLDHARELLDRIGESHIDPRTKLARLSLGQQQMVEIAKGLSRGAKVIAFDEPTSSLSAREIQRLFDVIRQLQHEQKVILYVTHRMEEVFELCDAATVFRDGQHIRTWDPMAGVTPDQIVNAMVGRDITDVFRYTPRPQQGAGLSVRNVTGPGVIEPISFDVAAGEIVGLFGLVGAGRSELLKLLYGATPRRSGEIAVGGQHVDIRRPKDAIGAGLVFCPEDRKKEGIVPVRSVAENLNLSAGRNAAAGGFVINRTREAANAKEFIQRLAIKTPSPAELIRNLSGGNQQKVILARWLSENNVRVILLDEPTRGIDVGAKSEIYNIIYELAARGVAVVVVSSDLPEVLGVSDRILVMRQGRLAGQMTRQEATPEATLRLALPVAA